MEFGILVLFLVCVLNMIIAVAVSIGLSLSFGFCFTAAPLNQSRTIKWPLTGQHDCPLICRSQTIFTGFLGLKLTSRLSHPAFHRAHWLILSSLRTSFPFASQSVTKSKPFFACFRARANGWLSPYFSASSRLPGCSRACRLFFLPETISSHGRKTQRIAARLSGIFVNGSQTSL